jgi:prepilin-type N-terminal cleavage/methylation domain-containing protein
MKSGFTLIELSIGLLLSGIIATALYNSFFVTHRVVDIAENFITTDFRAALIENQFGKDLEGVFVPEEPDLAKTSTQEKGKETQEKKEPAKPEEKPAQPLEKIFYSINGPEDTLNLLTFITNNPVKIYEKATNVKPKSRIVRVVYRLVPQTDNPKAFNLMRQESNDLDFKAFDLKAAKPIRAYELAQGIKNIKLEYTFPLQKEAPATTKPPPATNKEKPQKEEKPKPEYKTVKDWDLESKKDETKEQPKIPQFITITCELWDNQLQRDYMFKFEYEIPTFAASIMPKKAKKPALAPKIEKKETAATEAKTDGAPSATKPSLPKLPALSEKIKALMENLGK